MKPPYELKRKCSNCGIPNFRGMFCSKCDKIIYVSFQFDEYIGNPEHRLNFLESIAKHNVSDLPALRAEATRREKPMMHSLANRIANMIGNVPFDLSGEIFRRALQKSTTRAKQEAEAVDEKREATNAIYRAMAGVDTTSNRDRAPTAKEKAYEGFTPADTEQSLIFT